MSRIIKTPLSIYFFTGNIAGIVFIYTLHNVFILSATGTVSYLLIKINSFPNMEPQNLFILGLLIIVISGLFVGGFIAQYIYCHKCNNRIINELDGKTILRELFFYLTTLSLVVLCSANELNNSIPVSKNPELMSQYENIFPLFALLLSSSMIIGAIWSILSGNATTAMSGAVKETIMRLSGSKSSKTSPFWALPTFLFTSIIYYYFKNNMFDFTIIIILNAILIITWLTKIFCLQPGSKLTIQHIIKNCKLYTISKIEKIKYSSAQALTNIFISIVILILGLLLSYNASEKYINSQKRNNKTMSQPQNNSHISNL